MSLDQQIMAAVGAHGLWKGRLRAAIASGASDVSIDVVRDDHQCSFGKWLNGADIDPAAKKSKHYAACVELHRRFHQAAANVLSLATSGKVPEATKALGPDQDFGKISTELTRTMMAWKEGR